MVYFLFQKMLDRDVSYHPRGPGTGHLQLTQFRALMKLHHPLHSVENYQNSQNSEINVNLPSTQSTQSQIQNFGFVQASSVLGQNSQQNPPWGLTVNSQQGSNRGLTPEQMDTLNNNPPLLCFLHGTMARCQGCRTKFTENMRKPPDDLLVKMLVVKPRLINGNWVPGWQKSWGYFHLNINCLQRHLSFVEVEDIYVPNAVRCQMNVNHIDKLKKMGWWQQMRMRHSCTKCNVP